MEVMSLHSILSSFGDIVELDYKFNESVISELASLNTWVDSTNGKRGINLTGPIDDLGLESEASVKHARNQEYNDNLNNCPSLLEFFNMWTELARCRAVILNTGSYFKPHRDAYRFNDQFRIYIPLNKTNSDEHVTLYDGQVVHFKPLVPYILNTRKVHGSFSMADDVYAVLLSVFLNEKNLKTITRLLPLCSER
jgi:hypothetical protein